MLLFLIDNLQPGTWVTVMRLVDENQDGNLSIEEFKNAIKIAKQIIQFLGNHLKSLDQDL